MRELCFQFPWHVFFKWKKKTTLPIFCSLGVFFCLLKMRHTQLTVSAKNIIDVIQEKIFISTKIKTIFVFFQSHFDSWWNNFFNFLP